MPDSTRRAFVSGCFDLLHSGHVRFLEQAAGFGRLSVSLGSDRTVGQLKGQLPVCPEEERLYMVRALACVAEAFVARGSGLLDFAEELRERRPDVFVVNADGDSPAKRALCAELGVEYRVLPREPRPGLPARSSGELRRGVQMPYRIDLAGGWLDQPFVSRLSPGPVLVASLEGHAEFDHRSGMATSTRETALKLWGPRLPQGDPVELARLLFACENPPGKRPVAGSQDALGLVLPGLNRLDYAGEYWPHTITPAADPDVPAWLERLIRLLPLGERPDGFDVFEGADVTAAGARGLARAADACWQAIAAHDPVALGRTVRESFEAQVALFPRMVSAAVEEAIATVRDRVLGWKVTGAGGGGYLLLIAPEPPPGTLPVQIRR
jgi:cytidyltransferase-like protein